jgi:hypothetical protein
MLPPDSARVTGAFNRAGGAHAQRAVWLTSGLERRLSASHIPWMARKSHTRLLEVEVTPLNPKLWQWRVCEGDTPLMAGFATSRETAQIEGDSALFRLLTAG